MKKIILSLLVSGLLLSEPLQVRAESYSIMGSQDLFQTSISSDYFVKGYAEEGDLGVDYLDNRICVRIGSSIEAESGQYINLLLDDGTLVPCVVAGVDEESERAITSVVANTFETSVSLSDLGYDGGMVGIITLNKNYKDNITIGEDAAIFAQDYVGNPYVWGGASLTNGADCSGFTMAVFGHFGISLPHNAAAQSGCGVSVSESEIQPGDLVFYSSEDEEGNVGIDHVAIYIGDGKIVHASNPDDGIKISQYNYRPITCIRRLM